MKMKNDTKNTYIAKSIHLTPSRFENNQYAALSSNMQHLGRNAGTSLRQLISLHTLSHGSTQNKH